MQRTIPVSTQQSGSGACGGDRLTWRAWAAQRVDGGGPSTGRRGTRRSRGWPPRPSPSTTSWATRRWPRRACGPCVPETLP